MAKIAVLGHGVVGSGVCEVALHNREGILRRAGEPIEVKRILDHKAFPALSYRDAFTADYADILGDAEISVVVETMGGLHPAFEYSAAALARGKSVVTSNKELVAEKGAELLALARENGCNYFFEASVGGGIPIIRPLHICLAANRIDEIAGILNGTTNFILTKMIREQMDFSAALSLAQKLGYAERDPSADVDGHDACRKICILASLAFGRQVRPEYVQTVGIRGITSADVDYADSWGGVVKLIARAKRGEHGRVECMVTPAFVRKGSQLASIDDVYNGVLVRGDATGDVVFYGKGAGKLPTASAVIADVIDAVKSSKTSSSLTWEPCAENIVEPAGQVRSAFYVRLRAPAEIRARQAAEQLFGELAWLPRRGRADDELAFATAGPLAGGELSNKLAALALQNVETLAKLPIVDY